MNRRTTLSIALVFLAISGCNGSDDRVFIFDIDGLWMVHQIDFAGKHARDTEYFWLIRAGDTLDGYQLTGTASGEDDVEIDLDSTKEPSYRVDVDFTLTFAPGGNYVRFTGYASDGLSNLNLALQYTEFEDGQELKSGSINAVEQFPKGTLEVTGACQGVTFDHAFQLPFDELRRVSKTSLTIKLQRITGLSTDEVFDITIRHHPQDWKSAYKYTVTDTPDGEDDIKVELSYHHEDGGGFEAIGTTGTFTTPELIEYEVYMMGGAMQLTCPDGGELTIVMHNI